MKRLYENIEDIHIKGGVGQLTEIVRTMDITLQKIADATERLVGYLARYSSSNKGQQYEKVVNTSITIRDELFEASLQLNDMQKQIVAYQNKIYRYEDMSESATAPNPYLVTKRTISTDMSSVQFSRTDMIRLAKLLREYSEKVYASIKMINQRKNDAASIWMDSQYDDFAEFIEKVTKSVVDALRVFEGYVIYLEKKIKEL